MLTASNVNFRFRWKKRAVFQINMAGIAMAYTIDAGCMTAVADGSVQYCKYNNSKVPLVSSMSVLNIHSRASVHLFSSKQEGRIHGSINTLTPHTVRVSNAVSKLILETDVRACM